MAEQETEIDFYYIDVDASPELAEQFEIRSIPTLVLLKRGQEVQRSVGGISETQVKEFAYS